MEYPRTKQDWLKFIRSRPYQSMVVNCKYWPQLYQVRALRALIKDGKIVKIRECHGSMRSRRTVLKIKD